MTIYEKIKADLTEAMRAKDTARTTTLRGILSAFTNELVAQKKRPDETIDDETATRVLQRAAKQRKDSIAQFEKGGRRDLAENERAELAVIEEYLPAMMSEEEIRAAAEKKKEELGITDPKQKGALMGALMKDLSGRADGGTVARIVGEIME